MEYSREYKEGALAVTPAQGKMLAVISENVLGGANSSAIMPSEYKRFNVRQFTDFDDLLFVECTIGRVGDEGTALEIMARDDFQFSVGKKGGVTLLNPAKFVRDANGDWTKARVQRKIKGKEALSHLTY